MNDEKLQSKVQDAIKWEPLLDVTEIGVTAKEGIITLTGTVDSYAKKLEAEKIVRCVKGVRAIVEEIEVKSGHSGQPNDSDIAREILNAFKWNWKIPNDEIQIKVENGWVTLEGEVTWNYEREAAIKAVHNLIGIKGVMNKIQIESESGDIVEKGEIQNAINRSSILDHKDVKVDVKHNEVTLSGHVHSLYEKDEAEQVAWNASGVWSVKNELVVQHYD